MGDPSAGGAPEAEGRAPEGSASAGPLSTDSATESPRFEFTADQTFDDLVAYYAFGLSSIPSLRKQRTTSYVLVGVIGFLLAFLFPFSFPVRVATGAALAVVFEAIMWVTWRDQPRRLATAATKGGHNRMVFGSRRFIVDELSFGTSGHHGGSVVRWTGIERIEADEHALYVFISAQSAFIIPRRAFDDPAEFESLFGWCRAWHEQGMREAASLAVGVTGTGATGV